MWKWIRKDVVGWRDGDGEAPKQAWKRVQQHMVIDDSSDCGFILRHKNFLRWFRNEFKVHAARVPTRSDITQDITKYWFLDVSFRSDFFLSVSIKFCLPRILFAVVGVFPVNGNCWQRRRLQFRLFRHSQRILNEIFKHFSFVFVCLGCGVEEEKVELVAACCDVFTENHEFLGHTSSVVWRWFVNGLLELKVSWVDRVRVSNYRHQLAHLFLDLRNVLNFQVFPIFQTSLLGRVRLRKKFVLSRC